MAIRRSPLRGKHGTAACGRSQNPGRTTKVIARLPVASAELQLTSMVALWASRPAAHSLKEEEINRDRACLAQDLRRAESVPRVSWKQCWEKRTSNREM